MQAKQINRFHFLNLNISTTYSEDELVQMLQQRSREGFNYLYHQYSAVLYGIIIKVLCDEQTAQDILQEVFIKVWNNIGQYNPQKAKLYTWMANISRNAVIDKLRSKGEIMKGKTNTGEHIFSHLEYKMKTTQPTDTIGLRKTVAALKPEHKTVIDLAYFKGYTLDEVSQATGIPLGTVKTRMRTALQKLRLTYVS